MSQDDARAVAAHNNAHWCDLVCRGHGGSAAFHPDAWVNAVRSPPAYPDAVTLRQEVDPGLLLARVDRAAGCSIKDSFASLDLSGSGFEVLFDAEWIIRSPAPAPARTGLRWQAVRTTDQLEDWAQAHGGREVFHAGLLKSSAVVILAATDSNGALVAGVVGNRTGAVVGLSNLFTTATDADADEVWAGAVAALAAWFPDLPLVGYEHGDSLAVARQAGFDSAGGLRVWLRPGGLET